MPAHLLLIKPRRVPPIPTNKFSTSKIYDDSKLEPRTIIKRCLTVQNEDTRQAARVTNHYNMQMIVAVDFKVNNEHAVQFRKWANGIVKD